MDPLKIQEVIEEKMILVNQIPTHVDIYDIKPPQTCKGSAVFIHGTAVYSRFYAEFCYHLWKKGYRIIAPDLPGHGLSRGSRGHFTMNQVINFISEIISFVQHEFPGKITLMGSSLGGIACFYAVAAHLPVDAAICHNAAVFSEHASKSIVKVKGIYKLLVPFVPIIAKIFPKMRISVLTYLPVESLANTPRGFEIINNLMKDPLVAWKYTLTALKTQMEDPPLSPIEEIITPVMFINGENDALFSPVYMQSLYERLTCPKEFQIIPDQAHLLFQEQPLLMADLIAKFLDKQFTGGK